MESTKVVKKLGTGVIGTTYLIVKNGKKYVCKIEKISKNDTICDTSKSLWREIEFRNFTKNFPNHFMQLKSWGILDDCTHKQPIPPNFIDKKVRLMLIDKQKSPYCSQLVYTPVLDGTLNKFNTTLNDHHFLNKKSLAMMCQVLYALGLLALNGYMHGDIHGGNIMYKKTDRKTINLGGISVPTYGKQWFMIDYGYVLHKKFDESKDIGERKINKRSLENKHMDTSDFLGHVNRPIWKVVKRDKLKIASFGKLIARIKKHKDYVHVKKFLPAIFEKETIMNCMALLFLILFPIEYHKLMGINVVKYAKYIIDYDDICRDVYSMCIRYINKPMIAIRHINETYL